ncbi:MAG: MMPL family transporter [Magnetococcales bacterium]|nr:MMPL family transporter [Magnetococcales bacterium]
MSERYAAGIHTYRWLIILLTLLIAGAAGSGVRLLRFDTDYRVFFGKDNPQLLAFEELQDTYTRNDNVMFVLAPKDGRIFTNKMLRVVQSLTEASWQVPYSIRVDSVTNFQHTEAEEDDLIVRDLVEDPATMSAEDLAKARAVALAEPNLLHKLISPKADVTAVNVTIQLPGKRKDLEVPEVAAFVRKMADEVRADNPHLEVHLTGMAMMNNAFPEASKGDMANLIPLMFGVVILAITLLLRSFWSTLSTVIVILFSIITAMGLAGWSGIVLTGPSASAPTIILTMAVADCIHLLVTFLGVYAVQGAGQRRPAMSESLRVNLQPVFLTSLTTALGFLSMNFSDAPPFHDLGNIVAMGVVAAFVYSVTLLPALISVMPVRLPKTHTRAGKGMDWLAEFVIRRRKGLLPVMAVLVVGLSAFLPTNELNDEFVKYFSTNIEFRRATDFTTERLTGLYMIEYSLDSGESSGVAKPEFLLNVEKLAVWYRQQPEVIHVNTITDTFKRLNKNLHGGDSTWYRLPEARDLAAQYLLLYEMSLPYGLDLNNQINVDKSKTRFSVTLKSLSTNQMLALADRARGWMAANLPSSMQVEGASPTIMFSHIGKRNIKSMLGGTSIALVLISLSLIVALKSLRMGLISLIPNLVPAAMAFGLWGIMVGRVGLALSVVTGMTLGIIVDDTVHFLSKYLRARREKGLSSQDAVRYAFSTVGTALWVTTVVLIAGFMILTMSDFKLNADMGLLTAIAIGLALVVDFLLLPVLLIRLEDKDESTETSPLASVSG